MSSDDEFDLGGLLADIGARRLGFDVIHGPGGDALLPRTTPSLDEWEQASLAMHQHQQKNMLRVDDDTEDSSEPEGEAVDRLTVTRI